MKKGSTRRTRRVEMIVSFQLPLDASIEDARDYVEAALRGWCGCLEPDEDPMANLKQKTVKIGKMFSEL